MPLYNVAHRSDDETDDCPEVVGSKDLRESFKEGGRVRGSFFLNGYEFHQFESNSIENLIALLNAKRDNTHVRASIDDGYHLVLEADSPGPIRIRAGAPYVEPPPAVGGNVADDVVRKLKATERKDEDDGKPKNSILDDLGLEATADDEQGAPGAGVPPPGMSAEDRKKAREAERQAAESGTDTSGSLSAGTAGQTDRIPTEPSSPVTGGSGAGGQMADGTQRTGQGAGYSAKPDGTPAVAGTPAREAVRGKEHDPKANVPHRADHKSR